MPTPDSEVVRVVRAHRLGMNALDETVMREMGERWLAIERALDANIAALANETLLKAQAGEITPAMIRRTERYQILKAQMQNEIAKYNKDAAKMIASGQENALRLGIQTAQDAIYASFPSPLSASFNRINIKAVESMIGFAGDGSPLSKLLKNDVPDAAERLLQALIDGVAQGKGADAVSSMMANGMGIGLDRSLLIARTELNRSYRAGSTEQYRESGVTEGFMRLVARDEACLACLILDGERFDSEDEMDDHPNGRCTAVPIISGMPLPDWEKGASWFANQSEAKQREIMGDTRFELWQNGTPLDAFAGKKQDNVWGASPQIITITDLINTAHGNLLNITGNAIQGDDLIKGNQETILRYAEENRIAKSRIVFSEKDTKDEFGNTKLGEYNFETRKITMYPTGMARQDALETMVHESAHLLADKPQNFNPTKDSIFTEVWKKVTDTDDRPKFSTIRDKGFVSEYTSDILKQFGKRNTDLVLNEAWAELSRLDSINQLNTASPFWQDFYKEMKKATKK